MNTRYIVGAICLFCASLSSAQSLEKDGNYYKQDGKAYKLGQLLPLMTPYPKAYKLIKTAKFNNASSQVFGFAGGFLVGWPLGQVIGGGPGIRPNWEMAIIGAGCIVGSLITYKTGQKQANKAVEIYNAAQLQNEPEFGSIEIHMRLSPFKASAIMTF